MNTIAIGVDIGGSHISCAACDLSSHTYLPETHSENGLDNQGSAGEIIDIWARTILETIRKTKSKKVTGIGFAMPGPFDYIAGIALFKGNNKKYENLYGLHVPELLMKEMKMEVQVPIRFINDATAFALGEDWIGKSSGTRNSLAITLGTGFGSAFLSNHLPLVTGNKVPEMGCVWHLPFKEGSADDYFSTRGLLKRYHERTGKTLSGVKELAALAPDESVVQNLFDDFGYNLGVFLHPWIKKADIEVLVIGGNISNAFHLFGESLKGYLSEKQINIRIALSELKETASIIGSALLADNNFYNNLKSLLEHM
jgi:glucokinase